MVTESRSANVGFRISSAETACGRTQRCPSAFRRLRVVQQITEDHRLDVLEGLGGGFPHQATSLLLLMLANVARGGSPPTRGSSAGILSHLDRPSRHPLIC
jgi:hypothetical protein